MIFYSSVDFTPDRAYYYVGPKIVIIHHMDKNSEHS